MQSLSSGEDDDESSACEGDSCALYNMPSCNVCGAKGSGVSSGGDAKSGGTTTGTNNRGGTVGGDDGGPAGTGNRGSGTGGGAIGARPKKVANEKKSEEAVVMGVAVMGELVGMYGKIRRFCMTSKEEGRR
nr:hypothetical protein Iba_chr10aCG13540 [Ipomoea batatas]GMD47214.1 hypothetical protein Iba_chr10eCG10750 [Ipomoea batatas]